MKGLNLELHKYSPEQSKAFVRGVRLALPISFDWSSVIASSNPKQELRGLLNPQQAQGRGYIIHSEYAQECYKHLNRVVASGRTFDLSKVLDIVKKSKQCGGVLLNGDVLPPNDVRIEFKH